MFMVEHTRASAPARIGSWFRSSIVSCVWKTTSSAAPARWNIICRCGTQCDVHPRHGNRVARPTDHRVSCSISAVASKLVIQNNSIPLSCHLRNLNPPPCRIMPKRNDGSETVMMPRRITTTTKNPADDRDSMRRPVRSDITRVDTPKSTRNTRNQRSSDTIRLIPSRILILIAVVVIVTRRRRKIAGVGVENANPANSESMTRSDANEARNTMTGTVTTTRTANHPLASMGY